MQNKIRHIFEQLPSEKERIERLVDEYPEFRTIFEDYEICITAFRYWSVSGKPEAAARAEEYQTFVQELYEELVEALLKFKP